MVLPKTMALQQNGVDNLSKIVSFITMQQNTRVEAGCYALFSNKSIRLACVYLDIAL